MNSNTWPFAEAERILSKLNRLHKKKDLVLFETGYGPSGLPHIGTFGEVARTSMVRNAFKELSDIPTKIIAFSDDMDGLRKVPDNVPQKEMLKKYIGRPLSNIPDPFEKFETFADYMNNKLKEFLDRFDFEYDFMSATTTYKSGALDNSILAALAKYDEIMEIMLPTLGEERQATYSPFLPICPETGTVLQVPIISYDLTKGTITYKQENSEELVTLPVTRGNCKMQWKADWALRWHALGIDYEMHGKDLIPTETLSSRICKVLGSDPPITYNYELFLDELGQKISKSKGNGISIDEWLKYANTESLSLFMYQSPKKAKRLYFDVIPKNVDDYITHYTKYKPDSESKYDNPVWHILAGKTQEINMYGLDYSVLLNLASACNAEDVNILWGFIKKYAPDASPEQTPFLANLVEKAVCYYNDFIKPNKKYKIPDTREIEILNKLKESLEALSKDAKADEIQNLVFSIGKEYDYPNLRDYFQALYEILLGQTQGPRFGSFIVVYGIDETISLIKNIART